MWLGWEERDFDLEIRKRNIISKCLKLCRRKNKFHFPPFDLFLVRQKILMLRNLVIVLFLMVSNLFSVTNPFNFIF